MKANKSEIFSLTFDDVAQTSKSGFDSISKLRSSILERLNGSFDQSDKQGGNVFDISKLESLKEQGNKNFFEKMQNIKQGKVVAEPKDARNQSKVDDNNFLELDFGQNSTNIQTKTITQTQANNYNDILDFNPAPQTNQTHQPPAKKTGSDFDLLSDFSSNLNLGAQQQKPASTDNLLDFTGGLTTQQSHHQPNYNYGSSAFEINFDSKPTPPKFDSSSPNTDFGQMNFTLLASSDDKAKNGKKDKDPFDFIVF